MPLSFKSRLAKLEHKGQISQEEYNDLLKKLDGHDRQIRADAIEECIEILKESYPIIDNEDILYGFSCAIHRMEQLKEQKNE